MSATMTVNVTALLTSVGFDTDRLNKAHESVELVVDEFNAWQSWEIGNAPVMGCFCFRDPESDPVAA
ncbi:MAG TPA: hypothetical protein VJX10_01415 [Pseudonocardiaceae bacterium]|nr:hypothetical protein [Pseudonocardiaceae bacterium]